jgi:hypothetical protein
MIADFWPLSGLRLGTPRLELRVPDLDDLVALAEVAAAGGHDPAVQPRTGAGLRLGALPADVRAGPLIAPESGR